MVHRKTKKYGKYSVSTVFTAFKNHAGDGAHEVRWTSALRRPKRSGDLEPWVQGTLCFKTKKGSSAELPLFVFDAGDGT